MSFCQFMIGKAFEKGAAYCIALSRIEGIEASQDAVIFPTRTSNYFGIASRVYHAKTIFKRRCPPDALGAAPIDRPIAGDDGEPGNGT